MPDKDDPVRAAFGGREDLYDVATWDVRTWLDGTSVAVYASLKTAGRWALVTLAIALFVAELAFVGVLVSSRPTLGILAFLSIGPAVGVAGYFWMGDPTMREPLGTLGVTFVLAILFASFALVVNTLFFGTVAAVAFVPAVATLGPAVLFFVVVGPIEETVKWLAIRTYAFRRDEFDTVIDGVVYGAVAGLGFATIENLLYITQGYLATANADVTTQLDGAVRIATSRAFVGPGHVIYSAFAGYYLGLAKFNADRRGPIVVKGLLIAAFIHATYNTAVTYLPLSGASFLAFVVVFDGVLLFVLYRKLARYRRFLQRARAEGGPGGPATSQHDG